jgi:peroxiredoxin
MLTMGGVALGARVLLALVFTVAGAGKVADQPGTRAALRGFRVPEPAVTPGALALPFVELLTAVALLVQPTAWWGAIGALALLAAFATQIVLALARGEAPDCHCFGQLRSAAAGRGTLIRNAVLAVPAVFVLAYGPGTSLDAWLPSHSAAEAVALVTLAATAALAAIALQLHLQNRRLRRDLKRLREATDAFPAGPPIGAPAPRFSLSDVDGKTVDLDELLTTGRPLAMVFLNSDCASCGDLFRSLASWQRRLADRITIVIAATGSAHELRALSEAYGLRNLLVDSESELFELYRAWATPSALLVTADGKVASAMQATTAMVETLIRRALVDLDDQTYGGGGAASSRDEGGVEVVRWVASTRS